MFRNLIALLLGLLVFGCATTKQDHAETARLAFEASLAECRSKFPDRYAKPVSPRVSCLQNAATQYSARLAERDPKVPVDLQRIRSARINDLAAQYDSGAITRAEYDAGAQAADAEFNRAVGARG